MLDKEKKYILLKASSIGILAVGLLTGCSLGKNHNTTTTVVSENVITNSDETGLSTSTTTDVIDTAVTPSTIVEDDIFVNSYKYDKSVSEWLELIGKDHTVDQINSICSTMLKNATERGQIGPSRQSYGTAALLAKRCLSSEMSESIEKALATNHINSLDDMTISNEEKEYYDYVYKLYNAYISAVENNNAYLMIHNGAMIFDNIKNLESILLKNKITDQERLNYFWSYSDDKVKDSNLLLGDSLLRNYFEEMRIYVTQENYREFFDWTSTSYALENMFGMLEEQFNVEKINDKFVALKSSDMVFASEQVVTTTTVNQIETTTTTAVSNIEQATYTTGVVEQHTEENFYIAPNGELWTSEEEYNSWYGITKEENEVQKKLR